MTANARRLRAVFRKELTTLTSYRVAMVLRLVNIGYFAVSFYFIAELVGDAESLQGFSGGYFEFALVGSIVASWADVGISSFAEQISEEQNEGTLEAILVTPTPIWTVMTASHFVAIIFVVAETVLLVGVGLALFGAGIPVLAMVTAVPVLLLTTLSFIPIGILAAAFIVLVKRGDPITGPGHQLTLLLSGALYPLSVLPGWLEVVTKLVPATYGVRATRSLVQTDAAYTETLDEMAVLIAFAAIALPISLAVFRRAVTVARRAGTLGTY
ncbi:MAG: ABC transporter permease [Acidimicrobiales bacterium]|nr:ABC transporter permease [Acidimicrobiales bacterium]